MSHFCLLADPAAYSVSDADLLHDAQARAYWIGLFHEHFAKVLESAKVSYGRGYSRQIETARAKFTQLLEPLRQEPPQWSGPLGVLQLCRLREKALRDHGLGDPFRHCKVRENRSAINVFPLLIKSLMAIPVAQRWEQLVRGLFAGNIFDLGSAATMDFAKQEMVFEQVMKQVKPRPWVVDDFDKLKAILPAKGGDPSPWAKAVIFLDNAGADFVLGVMPLARELAAHGAHIVLAANELPSLNDVTADETVAIVEQLGAVDEDLAAFLSAGLFEVVSTGNDTPLIDLSSVSDELNAAAAEADLVMLEGMGRSVESNLNTKFSVDAIQMCILKDPAVAKRVNGQVFDCVCTYQPKPTA
jgi:damage-control phosphatase, subfamily II, stand-alone protein